MCTRVCGPEGHAEYLNTQSHVGSDATPAKPPTNFARGLLNGMIWETHVESCTGKYFYSDRCAQNVGPFAQEERLFAKAEGPVINSLVKIPLIGIVAGVTRVALAVIHTVGHLLAALVTFKKGHLFHAAKGTCEMLRGIIESIPIIGRIFANLYSGGNFSWWMIKIYNPEKPDALDKFSQWGTPCSSQHRPWSNFPSEFYVKE